MPYSKSRYGRRRYGKSYKRSRTSRYGRSRSRVRAPRLSKARSRAIANLRVGGQIGQELKYNDVQLDGYEVEGMPAGSSVVGSTAVAEVIYCTSPGAGAAPGATVLYLNNPAVGSAATQRDGRVIYNRSILIEGCVVFDWWDSRAPIPDYFFVALVLDTQCNGTTTGPACTDVYITGTAGQSGYATGTPNSVWGLRNLTNGKRFRVLAQRRLNLAPPARGTTAHNSGQVCSVTAPFRLSRKLGFRTHFQTSSTTAAVSNIIDNGLFLIVSRFSTATSGDPATIYPMYVWANSRLRFTG